LAHLALELRLLERFVVGLVLADLGQLVQVVLHPDALFHELATKSGKIR
jgi:hypothetical protein